MRPRSTGIYTTEIHTPPPICLQCLLRNMYSILNNWCICINISCGGICVKRRWVRFHRIRGFKQY